ncbi:MAG: glutamate-1-semialdehyde 2,1-aminomutase [Flavobacteriales bacterium]|nr:glutamate-1-semialdehyde 2,1-aminomutase [Flavobacteriales bacterium]MDG1781668.1 glutamate-1-semialdehyde 2,1-aminomutase [Flavobacteriales bacterium]MDG2246810.1 glutamate-1-semialdehyde 2,1-aminomutase [Flavobacteriales bacterium]
MTRSKSAELFETAKSFFPGGVNSPVRAFKSVGGTPLFIEKGDGAHIWDADGNEFVDYCCSWGPLILGHNNPEVKQAIFSAVENGTSFGAPTRLENELAELILSNHKYIEKIRFVSSGTEAAMSAIRLARGVTGRDKIIKFEGCYHGHVDALLVKAGSGLATLGTSSSAGIPEAYVKETLVLPLNDREALEEAVKKYKDQIACIAIEPIPANNGLLIQDIEFLKYLRELTKREGIILLFDEVISGFRVGFEGAAGFYGIQPDVMAFGKIIGGGMPVGAYGASAEVMAHIAPEGPVYQAGTLSGNPVAMAAGAAQLRACLRPGFYEDLAAKTASLVDPIVAHAKTKGYDFNIFTRGSIFWLAFSDKIHIRSSQEIDPDSMKYFTVLHHELLQRGVYIGPSGYEVGFVSDAHTKEDIAHTVNAFCEALDVAFNQG